MFDFLKKKEKVNGELLSIIIPSYNHALYIGEAIQSVINQT